VDKNVIEFTGPAIWTDMIFDYFNDARYFIMKGSKGTIDWKNFTGMDRPRKVGDVIVLPITGFSPGVGQMGAKEYDDPMAMVKHDFEGESSQLHGDRTELTRACQAPGNPRVCGILARPSRNWTSHGTPASHRRLERPESKRHLPKMHHLLWPPRALGSHDFFPTLYKRHTFLLMMYMTTSTRAGSDPLASVCIVAGAASQTSTYRIHCIGGRDSVGLRH
jgi:hypothetical protein